MGNLADKTKKEGSWTLVDNIITLSNLCMSWFKEYTNSIFQALRKRASQVQLADGKEVTLNQSFVLIATLNTAESEHGTVPMQLRSMFRVVALMEPDMEMLIRAKCIQHNTKAPNILSVRLKTLYDLCHNGFMSEDSKRQINMKNFETVLRTISDSRAVKTIEATAAAAATTATTTAAPDSRRSSITKETMSVVNVTNKYNVAKLESMNISNSHRTFMKILNEFRIIVSSLFA